MKMRDLVCEQCGRRMCGRARAGRQRDHVYYARVVNRAQHHHKPWFAEHPSTLTIREHFLLPVLGTFFADHVLGADRLRHLNATPAAPAPDDTEARALQAQLAKLDRAQQNLLAQLEAFEPTGDDDTDTEWRTSLQKRFTTVIAERRQTAARIAELGTRPAVDLAPEGERAAVLSLLPVTSRDLTQLPEEIQRQLYDAFHLQIRYHHAQRRVTIQVTVSAPTAQDLADSITAAVGGARPGPDAATPGVHLVSTPGTRLSEPAVTIAGPALRIRPTRSRRRRPAAPAQ